MSYLALHNIRKDFGDLTVLQDIELFVAKHEFCVLVGPSGCGKSTLLRIIAGLEDPTSGNLSIDGEIVNDLRPRDRNISMVFQNYALYPHMNVRKNMEFGLKIMRTPQDEIDKHVNNAASILDLEPYMKRYPGQLSGGQRQRVAMGRAIVRDPRLFLFDEPLSNLDAKLRTQMRLEIRSLHLRLKSTTIYVTHDQIEAMTMADKIVVMDHGRIEQVGRPLDLFDNPQSLFVASFLGSPEINTIHATTKQTADGWIGETSEATNIRLSADLNLTDGQRIVIGIRPHHLEIDGPKNEIDATVRLVETTGSQTLVYCSFGGTDLCCETNRSSSVTHGQSVHLGADPDHHLVFDASSGARILAK